MVYASLSFGSGLTALEGLVAALYALPPPLRPTHHSIGEDDVRQPTGEATALVRMLETGGSRFLWGRGVSYSVSPLVDLTCRAFFSKVPSQLARAFLEGVSAAEPVFGYACAWEELLHRNRLFVQIDGGKGGTSENWVGRDHSKWVPGLYWLTLLSEAMAQQHGLRLRDVEHAAAEHALLQDGLHLFRFYRKPSDWRERRDAMDSLCKRLPGVFNINEVRPLVTSVKSFAELDRILRACD